MAQSGQSTPEIAAVRVYLSGGARLVRRGVAESVQVAGWSWGQASDSL